jgi:tetrahydromethanopterin S-methyltransferase subunit H
MYKFEKEQIVVQFGDVLIGGQPGQYATTMCGSIFYGGHKLVKDGIEGEFDKVEAKELLDMEGELCRQFGLQRMPDVVGDTAKALIKYVDFVLENTDSPMLVDSASIATLHETFRHFSGSSVMDRLVYSPIDVHHADEQFSALKGLGIKNALILAFSPTAVMPEQKLELLLGKEWKTSIENGIEGNGLISKAKGIGIENLIVDVGVIDLQGAAWSAISIKLVKEKLGFPAGCAPANALFSWQRNNKDRLKTPQQTSAAGAAVYSSTVYWGANFALYGPMRVCDWAYPAIATTDALVAYGARLSGTRPKEKTHPLFNLK